MRSPANMKIIQIDITNACTHNCANCTRFCGLHQKPFFMDYDTFIQAVDSMKGYSGIVGIMGGEPTLHPEFDKFLDYYQQHIPESRPRTFCTYPLPNFRDWVSRAIYQRGRHRGLWSSLGPGYYRHFEKIQDVFPYQVLNDHQHIDQHQALLIPRKELGIPDEEWYPMRDHCWIQNLWSASITPKGAFFCEIAAALDMLFDGPGGWPIEPGWWKRKPEDFKEQLRWCEFCSAALKVPSLPASSQTDLISPQMLEKLEKIGGWKIKSKHYTLYDCSQYNSCDKGHKYIPTWFLPDGDEKMRVATTTSTLFPQHIDVFVKDNEANSTISPIQLKNKEFSDFLIVYKNNKQSDFSLIDILKKRILNPGFLYFVDNDIVIFNRRAENLKSIEPLDIEILPSLWSHNKISKLRKTDFFHKSLKQHISQICAVVLHRLAFLLPERKRNK